MRQVRHVREARADVDPDDRADEVLALTADVEEAAAKRERDREPGEDQRGCRQQRLREVVRGREVRVGVPPEPDVVVREGEVDVVVAEVEEPVEPGAFEDRLVRAQGVVTGREHDDSARQERDDGGEQRRDDPARALVERELAGDRRGVRFRIGSERRLRCRRGPGRRPLRRVITGYLTSCAGHCDPDLFLAGVRRELGHDAPFVEHEDSVGEREDLLELERDEQYRLAGVPLLDEAAVHELDRADVKAAGGLCRDQDARIARDLPCDDHLLLIAAGQ